MQDRVHFSVRYDGPALFNHTMDVRELAPALVAFSDLFQGASKAAFPNAPEVLIKVRGNFKAGSFGIDLMVEQSPTEQVVSLFSGQKAAAFSNMISMLSALGLVGGGGLIALIKPIPLHITLRMRFNLLGSDSPPLAAISGNGSEGTVKRSGEYPAACRGEVYYAASGRAPYAPRAMLGLILYGVMQGVHSLRALERLARLDLGCLWVSRGITPDHANIGRFIVLHEDLLTHDFFESFTRRILRRRGLGSTRVAGDGTVIEAACSHYKLLKEEAVKAHAQTVRRQAEEVKDDNRAQLRAAQAGRCETLFEERKAARIQRGKDTASLCISTSEPEAVMHRLKRGRGFAPAYKPSVLANEEQIITALAVDASSETAVVAQMLDQAARITGAQPDEALFDTGYFHDAVIQATLARGISLLCPAPPGEQSSGQGQSGGKFHKSQFDYDEDKDSYRCPAGQVLPRIAAPTARRAYSVYAPASCDGCALRQRCTAAQVRKIKRYPEDCARDALRQVMQQPAAQQVFRQRKAMVEPIFARLRGRQNLNRFRRRGLAAVTREFALHALAYNLARAVALGLVQALDALLLTCQALLNPLQNRIDRLMRQFSP